MRTSETPREPNPEQIAALVDYAKRHGRTWKYDLGTVWMNGKYDLDRDDSASLQQVRNTFGPTWLQSYRLPS